MYLNHKLDIITKNNELIMKFKEVKNELKGDPSKRFTHKTQEKIYK